MIKKLVNEHLLESLLQSSIRKLFTLASQHLEKNNDIVDLTLGYPYGDPPKVFTTQIRKLLTLHTSHNYMENAGYREVRQAIAMSLIKRQLMPNILTFEQIIMTVGASGAMNCIFKSILNPRDEVIILAPYFPDFPNHVSNHGGNPRIIKLSPPDFKINVDLLKRNINSNTKAIILNTPNNPTGKVYTTEEIKQIHILLIKSSRRIGHPIFLISDEPYREITYRNKHLHQFVSPATNYPYAFMVYSFSKSLNIPGERIGYVVIHPDMPNKETISELISLAQRTLGFTNAPALMQKAIANLLHIKPDIKSYSKKRTIIISALRHYGYSFVEPEGAFYVFVKYPCDKEKFMQISQKQGFFVVPGKAFGISEYFRIAFSRDDKILEQAANKLKNIAGILHLTS